MSRRVGCITRIDSENIFSIEKDGTRIEAEIQYHYHDRKKLKEQVVYNCREENGREYKDINGKYLRVYEKSYSAKTLKELEEKIRETLEDCRYFLEHLEEYKKEFEKNVPDFCGYNKKNSGNLKQ